MVKRCPDVVHDVFPLTVDELPKSNDVDSHADEWPIRDVHVDCSEEKQDRQELDKLHCLFPFDD